MESHTSTRTYFSQSVIEKLQYYVYCLTDPTRSNEVFYIGKGVGNRVFNHMQDALAITEASSTDKLDRIREIHADGKQVGHNIIRHGMDEITAFEVEAALIDFADARNLTNVQGGHHCADFGVKTAEEIIAMYEAEPLVTEYAVLLINLNRLYKRDMSPEDLYEATRKSWVIGERRNNAVFGIATYRGLTREIYRIDNWYPIDAGTKTRWGFNGRIAEDNVRDHLVYKDITKWFQRGAANPIKYVNC